MEILGDVDLGSLGFLYDVAVPLGALAAAPVFLLRSLRHPEYRLHLSERLGSLPPETRRRLEALPGRPVWIHGVSVGEVTLAGGLADALAAGARAGGRHFDFVLSSTTPAGRDLAARRMGRFAAVFHFPLDWSYCLRRSLDTVRPAACIMVEAEIWPGFLRACRRRSVPVVLVNGRISERSFRRYRRLSGLLKEPLLAFEQACMQSEADAERARGIGIPADRVVVTGNMKFDQAQAGPIRLAEPESPVLVAGSTSPGEEEMVLSAVAGLGEKARRDLLVILAPRHRERFEEVARLLAGRGVPFLRRSELPSLDASALPRGPAPRVVLLDTVGELAGVYALATVAFVGGSLVPRGGQNLIEPAAHGVPVVFGPHTVNFSSVADALIAAGAGFRVNDPRELSATVSTLLADPDRRRRAGRSGRALIEAHRGATARTIERILPFLG